MSRIGFIGLGIMGSPMAANLVRAGHQVAGHDHKQSSMDRLAAAGGQAAATMGFRIDLHHKDMGIAMAAARDADASLPMTGLVDQLIAAARAQGYGKLDHSALLKVIESLSGQAGADAGSHGLRPGGPVPADGAA